MVANGSRRWFQYTDDLSLTWAVELDESTYETALLGFTIIDVGAQSPGAQGRVLQVSASRPLSMRYVNAQSTDGATGEVSRKRFYIGSTAALQNVFNAGNISVDGITWSVSSVRGEQRVAIPALDTGKTDGDIDANVAIAGGG